MKRKSRDYANYPRSGQFRYHGYAKGYMARWDRFLSGETDAEPPPFHEYIKDTGTAARDTREVEESYRRLADMNRARARKELPPKRLSQGEE